MDKKLLYSIVGAVAAVLIVNKITEPWEAKRKAEEEELLRKTDEIMGSWSKETDDIIDRWKKEYGPKKTEPITVRLKIDSPLRKHYTEI